MPKILPRVIITPLALFQMLKHNKIWINIFNKDHNCIHYSV